jgi:hypothetical protein
VKTACVFALLLSSSAALAGEPNVGRFIGDGITAPREIVAGRSSAQRAEEIISWFLSNDNRQKTRLCEKGTGCTDIIYIESPGNDYLGVMTFKRGKQTEIDYCRNGEYFMMCYSFASSVYRVRIRDGFGQPWRVPGKGLRGDPEPADNPAGLAM